MKHHLHPLAVFTLFLENSLKERVSAGGNIQDRNADFHKDLQLELMFVVHSRFTYPFFKYSLGCIDTGPGVCWLSVLADIRYQVVVCAVKLAHVAV